MLWFFIIVVAAIATWSLPLPGKIIALVINYFFPEGVPFIDEIIQIVGIFKSVFNGVAKFFEWVYLAGVKLFSPILKIFNKNSNFGVWFVSCFIGLLLIEVIIDHWIISTIILVGGLILSLKKYF